MSDSNDLDGFRNTDGTTSAGGQRQAGQWEAQRGYSLAPQQSWEDRIDYENRMRAYDAEKNKG